MTEDRTGKVETYTGATGATFKKRLGGHRYDMSNPKARHSTTLSSHVWGLKDKGEEFGLKWELVERAPLTTLLQENAGFA